ncbi:hypothetical protein FGG08_004237 [Glutinoglossum americanum]|uniref:tRNA(Phe) (4-demethylwyosine(37)-C(7)) aminocarboxypropyltransferase n=1 Tax=Glutinoglossum americanum TaxID=1670608 RepID=A0A9P8L2Q8_9PEZI|nr:hypothetical protein FGG08_004237 [Glutinoglossum americanum]
MASPLQIFLFVPKRLVKSVKCALEERGRLDKTAKIRPWSDGDQVPQIPSSDYGGEDPSSYRIVPTLLKMPDGGEYNNDAEILKRKILREIGFEDQFPIISLVVQTSQTAVSSPSSSLPSSPFSLPILNPLTAALQRWLCSLSPELCLSLGISSDQLLRSFTKTYSLYHPMVLLPANAFNSSAWPELLSAINSEQKLGLYKGLTAALNSTHLALNAPISLLNDESEDLLGRAEHKNILRRPTKLLPLYGDFGVRLLTNPSAMDFEGAFWVSTRQNGIYQTWAPLYTMFSRGNISEKARILGLPSLRSCGNKCSVVDLYAGIGYFAFSYVAAGAERVFCWDLNPWSVEGLRRGSRANKWDVCVVQETDNNELGDLQQGKIVVFQEDNMNAPKRLQAWRNWVPPVRHVNCGLLPTSRGSWETAVKVLDEKRGGWVHVHENIAGKDLEHKKDEILRAFRGLVNAAPGGSAHPETTWVPRTVECQHTERVKSFAPGIAHYVLDIWISGYISTII